MLHVESWVYFGCQETVTMSYYLFMTTPAIGFLSVAIHGIWGRWIYLGFIAGTNLASRARALTACRVKFDFGRSDCSVVFAMGVFKLGGLHKACLLNSIR